jgi:hypothetical protein
MNSCYILIYAQAIQITTHRIPRCIVHAEINSGKSAVKKHPSYAAAKSVDDEAARDLVRETINDQQVEALRRLLDGRKPILVSVHAYESEGVNAIPEKFAEELADRLGLETDISIVQNQRGIPHWC